MNNVQFKGSKLKRIRYESSGGSMNYHSEFEIEASAEEVIRTCYWDDNYYSMSEENAEPEMLAQIDGSCRTDAGRGQMAVREHIPYDRALWEALSEEIGYLTELLRPVEEPKLPAMPDPDMFILDGGDYQRLYLTWETEGAEQTVQYYPPYGNRWSSVIEIIHEMARPIGRDLRRIGETQITDLFLKTPKYSYQITPIRNSDSYYFFVHGDSSDISQISREQWLAVRAYLDGTDVSGFKAGKYESKYYLRLKYNDGLSKELEIDKKTAETIKGFIRETVLNGHGSVLH